MPAIDRVPDFDFLVASTLSFSSSSRVLIRSGSAHSRPQWPGT